MKFRMYVASAAVALTASVAQAAPKPATLHGVVVDPAGKRVSNASVTVTRDTTVVLQTTTDSQGTFSFDGTARQYRVDITAAGFGDLHSPGIPFSAHGISQFTMRLPGDPDPAQRSYVAGVASHTPWNIGALAQGGVGVGDRSDYKFLLVGGHLGKVLTPELGKGLLRGNFEYGVELFPFWQSYTPHFSRIACSADPPAQIGTYVCTQPYTVGGNYTGVSVTPIILRWNFTHGEHWMPWVQGAGGLVWTNHKYPAIGNLNPADTASNGPHGDTSVWNFTPQLGVGVHYFLRPKRSLDLGANAVHISSASLGDKNPGVNASLQFSIGYSWWK